MSVVESLAQQCHTYIMMHLEEFPVRDHLSLLPLSTRKELLYHLPIADVCLRLENTAFTAGIDMAAFWNSIYDPDSVGIVEASHDKEDIEHYVQGKWDDLEYAREAVYGIVATCAMGHMVLDIEFRGTFHATHTHNCEKHKHFQWGMPVVVFLYAPRTSCVHGTCQPPFPSRYKHKSEKDLTMYEVVNCFSHSKGEFPRIFPEVSLYNINLDDVFFLRNAIYLGINGRSVFHEQGNEFLKAVLQVATNLEVLLLDHWGDEGEWEVEFFDKFCASLSSCQAFLSNFRLVKIFSWVDSEGLVVSRKNFNQLITAYFAAPTDHVQKLHIAHTKIKCSDVSYEHSPMIEQRYRSFKTIQISDCQFVSKYKATPKALSHWLGESISELSQSDPEPDTCFFKVGGKSGVGLSRKRKHSELESDHYDQAER